MSDNPRMDHPDTTAAERTKLIESAVDVQLSDHLAALRDRIVAAFGDLEVIGFRGELTLVAQPGTIIELLRFCRDDAEVRCELLSDLHGVHWPGGVHKRIAQETTGWPIYEDVVEQGHIELDYILTSVTHNHWFRIRVVLPDEEPSIASAVELYKAANFMEREVLDFLGVTFEGHPNPTRVLMPEDWEGHPHRKDYPLGGVDVQYKGAVVPPPDQRQY